MRVAVESFVEAAENPEHYRAMVIHYDVNTVDFRIGHSIIIHVRECVGAVRGNEGSRSRRVLLILNQDPTDTDARHDIA